MNERFFITLPASIFLWAIAIIWVTYALNHEVVRPMMQRDVLTVHLVSVAPEPAPPVQEAPSPKPEIQKPKTKPMKVKKIPPPPPKPQPKPPADATPPKAEPQAESNTHGAVVTYQPMPKIPDDLRREAFSTYATARFHIAADGSSTVELLTPSQNPRLNYLLLEALKTWRFNPASDNGKAIASTFDIRVRFAVE